MTQVFFYHLERSSLDDVLTRLLEASLARGWRAHVKCATPEQLSAVDTRLWVYRPESFLPHACQGDKQMEDFASCQPIWLSTSDDTPNSAHVLFLTGGTTHDDLNRFERCVNIFDGHDVAMVAHARMMWTQIKDLGHDLSYFQQSERGEWEKREEKEKKAEI